MTDAPKGIIALAPCGCLRGWCSGSDDSRTDRAKLAGQWIRAGYAIQSVTAEEARAMPIDCTTATCPFAAKRKRRSK